MIARRTIRITSEPFDISSEVAGLALHDRSIGATVTFTGHVRGQVGEKSITSMTLEHYPGMTEAELNRIIDEAATRWPLIGVAAVHRIGTLVPGDLIVLVSVASSHREAAFEAGAYIMDFLKTRAPFWKREQFADGTEHWVDARETDSVAAARWSQPRED
jgi:molybdopterin synthase catalytic subunit